MSDLCPHCEGTSWKRVDREGVVRVQRCACWAGTRLASVLEKTDVPLRYRNCAFDEGSGGRPFDKLSPKLVQACRIAERWAEEFPDVEAGLLFRGPPGVGKTHLAVAILRRVLIERSIAVRACFSDFRSLLRDIKGSYNPDTPATEMEVLQPVLSSDILVLDELGGESPTLWTFDTLFYILNHRYNQEKLTIITTNFSDQTSSPGSAPTMPAAARRITTEYSLSERITVRLRSRLYEMCRDVDMAGEDYRKITLQANYKG